MSREIDFVFLSDNNPEYIYSLEVYDDRNQSCGGCRTRTKDDLRAMNNLWKERYPTTMMGLRYIYKKEDKLITL